VRARETERQKNRERGGMWVKGNACVYLCIFGCVRESVCVRTDLTGKLSKHIYAPDRGPKLPS